MSEKVAQHAPRFERGRVMAAVADMAEFGLSERMRLDAAERVLVTARRMLVVAPREAAAGAAASVVLRVARAWDPAGDAARETRRAA